MSSPRIKTMLMFIFNMKGIIHFEFVSPEQPSKHSASKFGTFAAGNSSERITFLAEQVDFDSW
jgi:hypothetical protein